MVNELQELNEMSKTIEAMKRTLQDKSKLTVEERLTVMERKLAGMRLDVASLKEHVARLESPIPVVVIPKKDERGHELKDKIIEKIFTENKSFAQIAREVGCTRAYVQIIAKQQGITRPRLFTADLINKVHASLLQTKSGAKTARELGITAQTVYNIKKRHIKRLNYKREKITKMPVKYTKEVMLASYAKHHNYSRMAEELGTFPSTVSRVMKDLGLRQTCPPQHTVH